MAYVILATVKTDGTKTVRIYGGSSRPTARYIGDSLFQAGKITDYQTAECDDLADVRSCLMSNFGIGFFNVARPQMREIERRLADAEREAFEHIHGSPDAAYDRQREYA